jgi:hypothetical protein
MLDNFHVFSVSINIFSLWPMNLSNPNLKLKGGKYFFNHIILKQIEETPFNQIEKDCLLFELKLFIYL